MAIFEEIGIEMLARYGHILAGITWIGLLYYFNFAQTPAFNSFEAPARNEAFAKLVPRAIWWFRWAAAATLAFGLLIFALYSGGDNAPYDEMKAINVLGILAGMYFAVIMFLNVWLVIWPNQKVALGIVQGGDAAAAGAKAALASRTNVLFSGPMAFGMLAGPHFIGGEGYGNATPTLGWWLAIVLILVLEGNALFGKQGPLTTVRGVISSSMVLTAVLVALIEFL